MVSAYLNAGSDNIVGTDDDYLAMEIVHGDDDEPPAEADTLPPPPEALGAMMNPLRVLDDTQRRVELDVDRLRRHDLHQRRHVRDANHV